MIQFLLSFPEQSNVGSWFRVGLMDSLARLQDVQVVAVDLPQKWKLRRWWGSWIRSTLVSKQGVKGAEDWASSPGRGCVCGWSWQWGTPAGKLKGTSARKSPKLDWRPARKTSKLDWPSATRQIPTKPPEWKSATHWGDPVVVVGSCSTWHTSTSGQPFLTSDTCQRRLLGPGGHDSTSMKRVRRDPGHLSWRGRKTRKSLDDTQVVGYARFEQVWAR